MKIKQLESKEELLEKIDHELQKFQKNKRTKFWDYDSSVLKNIDDQQAMDENKHKTPDYITDFTRDETSTLTKCAQVHQEQSVQDPWRLWEEGTVIRAHDACLDTRLDTNL